METNDETNERVVALLERVGELPATTEGESMSFDSNARIIVPMRKEESGLFASVLATIGELQTSTKLLSQGGNAPKLDYRLKRSRRAKSYRPNGARELARHTRQVVSGALKPQNGLRFQKKSSAHKWFRAELHRLMHKGTETSLTRNLDFPLFLNVLARRYGNELR